ncbi:collagen-binding domain-containing protein [Limosilactobacillus secaliphilus]|nr:collagen-binding domain-containing protein [Limosilactobacillus secaliphilus]
MKKTHYKLYKSGKLWLTCLITIASLSVMSWQTVVKADNAQAAATVTQSLDTSDAPVKSEKQLSSPTSATDQHFQRLKDQTSKNPIGISDGFHIFAGKVSLNADCNGNMAAKEYQQGPEFGTRDNNDNHGSEDTYYIGKVDDMGANAFRHSHNYVVFGQNVNYEIKEDRVYVNGKRMDHLNPSDVHPGQPIDIDEELDHLKNLSKQFAAKQANQQVKLHLDGDQNNRWIDISDAEPDAQDIIYINVPAVYLSAPQPIMIKGLGSDQNAPVLVINVSVNGDKLDWNTQSKLIYDDGSQINPTENHTKPNQVLWDFGRLRQLNINSGYLLGSVLAPYAEINVNVNADGNLIGQQVNVRGGESHRWDLATPQPIPQPVIPKGNDNSDENDPTSDSSDHHTPQEGHPFYPVDYFDDNHGYHVTPDTDNSQPVTPKTENLQPVTPGTDDPQPLTPRGDTDSENDGPTSDGSNHHTPKADHPFYPVDYFDDNHSYHVTPDTDNSQSVTPRAENPQPVTPSAEDQQPVTPRTENLQPVALGTDDKPVTSSTDNPQPVTSVAKDQHSKTPGMNDPQSGSDDPAPFSTPDEIHGQDAFSRLDTQTHSSQRNQVSKSTGLPQTGNQHTDVWSLLGLLSILWMPALARKR